MSLYHGYSWAQGTRDLVDDNMEMPVVRAHGRLPLVRVENCHYTVVALYPLYVH